MRQLKTQLDLAAWLVLAVGAAAACSGGNITAEDCSVQCQNVENQCKQNCTDDTCRTKCSTDFNNCTLSCRNVTTQSDGGSSSKD